FRFLVFDGALKPDCPSAPLRDRPVGFAQGPALRLRSGTEGTTDNGEPTTDNPSAPLRVQLETWNLKLLTSLPSLPLSTSSLPIAMKCTPATPRTETKIGRLQALPPSFFCFSCSGTGLWIVARSLELQAVFFLCH